MAKKKSKAPLKDRIYKYLLENDREDLHYDDTWGGLMDELAVEAEKATVTFTVELPKQDLTRLRDSFAPASNKADKAFQAAIKKAMES